MDLNDKQINNTKVKKNYWINKFKFAFNGLFISIKEERSMIVHICISLLIIIFALGIKINLTSWAVVILTIGIVLGFELFNTSIENLIDLVSFKYNINAKKIKDIAAAATLIISIMAIVVGLLIFIPRIIEIANYGY